MTVPAEAVEPVVDGGGDAFTRVASALRAVLHAEPGLLASDPHRFRNLVLDRCGSDHRPLVELLVDVGRRHATVLSAPLAPGERWDARRAPLIHHLVATRYLQTEVTQWLVDAWGAAHGLLDLRAITSPVVRHAVAQHGGEGNIAPWAGAAATTARRGAARAATPAPRPQGARGGAPQAAWQPSAGAGPASPGASSAGAGAQRIGARPLLAWRRSGAPPVVLNARSPIAPASVQQVERVARVLVVAAAVMSLVGVVVIHRGRMAIKRAEEQADAALVSATTARVAEAVMAPEVALPIDSEPETSVASVASVATADASAPPIAAGIGGRYRVAQHVRSVTGFEHCEPVAAALATDRWSEETIVHSPGATAFTIPARGIEGRIDADGAFRAGPMEGTTRGVRWTFEMQGRFAAGGFVGESRTATEATLRWLRTQRCLIVAELTGWRERAP